MSVDVGFFGDLLLLLCNRFGNRAMDAEAVNTLIRQAGDLERFWEALPVPGQPEGVPTTFKTQSGATRVAPEEAPAPTGGVTPAELQARADELNQLYPVGTPCRYWLGVRDGEPGMEGRIRAPFYVVHGRAVVGWVAGYPGYIDETHIECRPE